MIVTVTANPSVDRTIEVAALRPGTVMRALASRVDAGGKGVNVARALAAHGRKAKAVLPSGGAEGTQLEAMLVGLGVDLLTVSIADSIRANVTVVEADGTTTKLNEPGPRLSRDELDALASTLSDAAAPTDWAVLSGSLSPGAPASWYAELIRQLRGTGPRIAIDSSGPPLAKAIAARPDLVKPNREELAELTGRRIDTVADVVDAAMTLTAGGVHTVLTSLGPAGAVLLRRDAAWHATAAATEPRSTVGAGDALLAGFLAAGADGPGALAEAVAWGTAAAALPGSRMPGPGDIIRTGIHITDLTNLTSEDLADRRLLGAAAMTSSIITPDLVDLRLEAASRQGATRELAQLLVSEGRVTDLDGFLTDVTAREQQMPTGIEGGIGIPHARSAFVAEPTLAFARSAAGVDFGAADGPPPT